MRKNLSIINNTDLKNILTSDKYYKLKELFTCMNFNDIENNITQLVAGANTEQTLHPIQKDINKVISDFRDLKSLIIKEKILLVSNNNFNLIFDSKDFYNAYLMDLILIGYENISDKIDSILTDLTVLYIYANDNLYDLIDWNDIYNMYDNHIKEIKYCI